MVTDSQKEQIIQQLRDRGCRITKQRLMLLDIILAEDCASTKEIFYKASRQDKSIGPATVYRMINTLEDVGALNRKNMYRIACGTACCEQKACSIHLDNGEIVDLNGREWNQVIQEGLRNLGYLRGESQVIRVDARSCDCSNMGE